MALLDKFGNEIDGDGNIIKPKQAPKPYTPPIPKNPTGSGMSDEEFAYTYKQITDVMNAPPIPLPGSPQHITIECHSILGANTHVLVGDTIKTMYDVSILSAGQALPTFALENARIAESEIIQIPAQVSVDAKTVITLNNGYQIECAPIAKFLRKDGMYTEAGNLKEGDKLYVVSYRPNTGISEEAIIIRDIHTYHLDINETMYLFMGKHSNMLLPIAVNEERGIMSFISVEQ